MVVSSLTSRWTSSTVPGGLLERRSLMAVWPLSMEREPRRMCHFGSVLARSWRASSRPMPPLAGRIVSYCGPEWIVFVMGFLPPVIRATSFLSSMI
jgi:hypothetical protein